MRLYGRAMEFRQLGGSGLKVPVLGLGTATFGGGNEFFKGFGSTGITEATRLVDIALDAGINLFDSADIYSGGLAEEILARAITGRRQRVLISTKAAFRFSDEPNDVGASRHHLIPAVEGALRRLGTDYIDLFQLHGFDALTPVEETLSALDDLVRSGKVRYVGCSNFSGWHVMKSLAAADKHNLPRYVVHQAYYSLVGRDYECELMPLGLDQKVSAMVWSPLGWGRLTGKVQRGQPVPAQTRLQNQVTAEGGPQVPEERLFRVLDALEAIGRETDKTIPQIALNWLLTRPTVANVIVGARNEQQLQQNLGAVGWTLTADQLARLDEASRTPLPYPYWHQRGFSERNPPPVE